MSKSTSPQEWRQHFPTYKFEDRDVLLKEYDCAARNVESNERIFLGLVNLILLVTASLISIGAAVISRSSKFAPISEFGSSGLASIFLVTSFFSALALHHFASRYKSIVIDSRKLIVLRRMLGLNYGNLQLVLPARRLEGATNPFEIKMFPGWVSPAAHPFWIIGGFTSLILFNAWPTLQTKLFPNLWCSIEPLTSCVIWLGLLALLLRNSLLDTHEQMSLVLIGLIAKILFVKLSPDFESIIYRARLAAFETRRLKVDARSLKPFLVAIEDKEFYSHAGISWRGIGRALLGVLGLKRSSGGSTLTQQLARTLFIVNANRSYRRKFVEVLLAKWLEGIFTKDEILDLYLGAVRFEHGIYGLPAAYKYFMGGGDWTAIRKSEAFFLTERVSNISKSILSDRIIQTLRRLGRENLMASDDFSEVVDLYAGAVKKELIKPSELERLSVGVKRLAVEDKGQL